MEEHHLSTPRATARSTSGSAGIPGLVWRNGQPVLQMQDAIVETVVTHTTRTTTSFAPISLPRLPEPDYIPMPSHLPADVYPLANEPTPDDMKYFAMHIAGQRVVVQAESGQGPPSPLPTETIGAGWRRSMKSSGFKQGMPRVGLVDALNGAKRDRKRSLSFSRAGGSSAPTPPVTGDAKIRARSPPRKRVRGMEEATQEGALLSPLPSPEQEGSSSREGSTPNIGSGTEMAALFSLPTLVTQFESLPDKLQQHIMMQLLRRSRMPTIQRVNSFAAIALKRDFVSALPHELAVQILRRVDTQTLACATRVSVKWKRIIDSERAVWKQRLVDDDLWHGLGTEEEEELVMKQRLEILQSRSQMRPKGGTPSEEELMDLPSAGPYPPQSASFVPDHPIPLKHVYRRRYTSERNWLNKNPIHRSFPGQGMNVVTCTQFDKDKIITASDDHSINIYDIKQGSLKRRLDGHEGGVWALEYRGDTLVTGSTDRTVRVWDLETYEEVHTFHGHSSTVRCLHIVEPVLDEATGEYMPPYPMFVTGSRDSSLRVWKLPKKGEERCNKTNEDGIEEILKPEDNPYHLHLLSGHTQAVRAIATYGRLCMSGSYDCTVRVWDIIKGTCLHVLTGHEARVYSLVYDRYRNRCASGSMDNTVKVWDVATGECLHTLSGHTALVGLLETSPNYLVSAAADASLRIWDANTHALKHVLGAHGGAITCFAHDETKVVSGSEGSIKLWDIRTGKYIRELVVGIQSVWQVVFKDNILVAATSRGGATVFEIFDFGALDDPSGVDDDSLDGYRKPAWERENPREPQTYQFDPAEGEIGATAAGGVRYHGAKFRNTSWDPAAKVSGAGSSGSKARRSARIADQSDDAGAAGPSRSSKPSANKANVWGVNHPAGSVFDPPTARRRINQATAHGTPRPPSSYGAGSSNQARSSMRRTSEMARRSDSPTPVGESYSGVDMLAATNRRNRAAGPSRMTQQPEADNTVDLRQMYIAMGGDPSELPDADSGDEDQADGDGVQEEPEEEEEDSMDFAEYEATEDEEEEEEEEEPEHEQENAPYPQHSAWQGEVDELEDDTAGWEVDVD